MSAAFEQYLQPPAPDPERAVGDTSESVEPAVEEIYRYLQPPPSNLRPAHDWAGGPPSGPRPWVSKPVSQAITGSSLSLAGHVLTWTSFGLGMSQFDRWWLPTFVLAVVSIVAGIVVSARARMRYRRGLVGGSMWSGLGLALGILWVVLAVGLVLLILVSGPMPDV